MTKLIDQPLAALRLLHNTFLVVLSDAATQLVVVHCRAILAFAPKPGNPHRVLDLEDALVAVQPAYARAVHAGTLQQLLEELPQVDVRATVADLAGGGGGGGGRLSGGNSLLLLV